MSRDPERARQWREANRERRSAQHRAHYAANRDTYIERTRARYAANRDQINEQRRQQRRPQSAADREYRRQWRAANRGKVNEQARARYAANRDKRTEQARARYAANREQARQRRAANSEQDRVRRIRSHHGLWPHQWQALWVAQDGRCYLCGEPLPDDRRQIHLDHDHRCCPPNRSCPQCQRGLAHSACNALIGLAGDDPAKLRVIAANLARAKRRTGRLPKPLTLFDYTPEGLTR